MQNIYIKSIRFVTFLCVFFFIVSHEPSAKHRKKPTRKTARSSKNSENVLTVALVYRNDISQFVQIITIFKKTAPYEFVDLSFNPRDKGSKKEAVQKLENLSPDSALFAGPESWNIWNSMKKKPRNSVAVVVDPTIPSPSIISLGPTPEESIAFLQRIYPKLTKPYLIAKDDAGLFAQSFFQKAEKAGIPGDLIQFTSPSELVASLGKKVFSPGDAIVLGPDIEDMTHPIIETLLLLEKRQNIPIIGFSRNHVELGLLAAYQKTPGEIAFRAAQTIMSLLAKGKSIEKSVEEDVSGWWYNSTVASHLGISKNLLKKTNARPVFSVSTTHPPKKKGKLP